MAFLLVFDKKCGFAIDVKFRKFYFVSPLNKSFGQVLCKGAPLYTRSGIFHAIMLKTVEDVTITSFSIFVLVSYSSLSSTLLFFYSCWIEIVDDFFMIFRHNVDDKFCRFLDAVCFT